MKNLKTQLNGISKRVSAAEKTAEKQFKLLMKSTEQFREQQIKNVQKLIKNAKHLRQTALAKQAEGLKKDLEVGARAGFNLLLQKLDLTRRKDFERLQRRVSELEKLAKKRAAATTSKSD